MKLELKHLSGYLPYGLKVLNRESIFEMDIYSNMRGEGIEKREMQTILSSQMKPILHPLSDITKEIEVNGEKFVPMERLLDIESGENWSCSYYLMSESGQNEWWVRLKENKSFIFGYNNRGFYMLNQFSEAKIINNQIELWHKLLEWHFDIYGLIDNGLAIDINTLQN